MADGAEEVLFFGDFGLEAVVDFFEFGGAFLDFLFEAGVYFTDVLLLGLDGVGHAVEGVGELTEFVGAVERDAVGEIAVGEGMGAFGKALDGDGDVAGDEAGDGNGEEHGADAGEQDHGLEEMELGVHGVGGEAAVEVAEEAGGLAGRVDLKDRDGDGVGGMAGAAGEVIDFAEEAVFGAGGVEAGRGSWSRTRESAMRAAIWWSEASVRTMNSRLGVLSRALNSIWVVFWAGWFGRGWRRRRRQRRRAARVGNFRAWSGCGKRGRIRRGRRRR